MLGKHSWSDYLSQLEGFGPVVLCVLGTVLIGLGIYAMLAKKDGMLLVAYAIVGITPTIFGFRLSALTFINAYRHAGQAGVESMNRQDWIDFMLLLSPPLLLGLLFPPSSIQSQPSGSGNAGNGCALSRNDSGKLSPLTPPAD